MNKTNNFLFSIFVVVINSLCLIASLAIYKTLEFGEIKINFGILIFPLTYLLIDIVSEKYKFAIANLLSILFGIFNFLITFVLSIISKIPSYSMYDVQIPNNFIETLIISLVAFIVSQILNNFVFKQIRKNSGFFLSSILAIFLATLAYELIFECSYVGVLDLEEIIKKFAFTFASGIIAGIIFAGIVAGIKKIFERKKVGD